MKCAIYARVSTAEGKQSYERQVTELKELAIKDGYKAKDIEIFAEMQSGFDKDRNKLNDMLDAIKQSPTTYSMVYVSELSRLGRNVRHTREIIEDLSDLKIPIWIQNLKQSTLDRNGKTSFGMSIVLQVLLVMGKYEADTLKERSASGRMQRAKNGYWAMGSWNIPYGYRKNEVDGKIEFDDEEIKIVKQIFKWYLSGKGFKMIATLLNGMYVPTRSNKAAGDKDLKYKMYTKKGSQVKWVDATIKAMVENPIYYGVRRFKGEEIELPHLAIITKEQYNEIQQIRLSKTNKNHLTIYPYLLKNHLGCGVCGRGMSSRYAKNSKKDKIYKCTSALTNGSYCQNHSINIDMIESILLDILVRRTSNPLTTINLASTEFKQYEEEISNLNTMNVELNKEVAKEEAKKNRLVYLFKEGLIKKDELTEQRNDIENSIKNLKKRIR
jgi:DNA invertase Pin-like site-specific DNA recombinase